MRINFLRRIIGRTLKQMRLLKVVTLVGLLLGVGYTICLGHAYSHDKDDHAVFGPKKFDRDRGKPAVEKVKFSVAKAGTEYTLRLVNGDGHRDRDEDRDRNWDRDRDKDRDRDRDRNEDSEVSSAKITLNGVEVIGPSDFHHHVKVIERKVTLQKSNVLTVRLEGRPGSFITITITGSANFANVPNVVGMTQADAQAAITSVNLVVGTVTTASSSTVPAGSVISQNPTAGANAVQGSSVNLVVSSGPPTSMVPNVVGMTQADAQTAITSANFVVGTITTATSNTVHAGYIISQNPAAGATVLQGSSVDLVVSTGPPMVSVPNVTNMALGDAQTAVTSVGLVVGTVNTVSSDSVPVGTVISQSPAAGTNILAGSAVNLTVSSGPPPIAVPDVTGITQQAAASALSAKGLTLGAVTSANSATAIVGTVISQNPAAGTDAVPGSSVSIVISLGPAANTNIVPKVIGFPQGDASAPITSAGLTVGVIDNDYSATVPSGSIISQYPLAGAKVPAGSAVNLIVSLGSVTAPAVPPDPQTVAPPPDTTVATTVAASSAFLYMGDNPIQTGVPSGTIELRRAAVIRGLITDRNDLPISGVHITIKDHPEFGQTYSRTDGMFDMAVNGGGYLTVNYENEGYLPAQRQVNAPWQDYAWLPTVVLIPVDSQVTTIDLTSASEIQVHQGNVVTDADGTRQATLLFSPGTTAQMVMPDGSTQSLASINVRATEYTVGPNGPKAMPGVLPSASGYTYAVELSADEAITAGAKQVTFSQPVYVYVDNFIGFPVGGPVPTGYYDRGIGQWIASQNGRVIKILSITGGLADIDTNGDGLADNATTLATLGITDAERQQLAALYRQTPKQLWRVPVTHFSPWDCNWPYGPPPGATAPAQPEPKSAPTPDPCEHGGSIIECQNQVLGERIVIPGTSFTLNYRSSRVPGHTAANTFNIPLSGASVPAGLKRIDLIIQVAGRRYSQSFPAAPNQDYTFTWDGKDAYGQSVQGKQPVTVQIGYVYGAVYMQPSEAANLFGRFSNSGISITGSREYSEVTLWQKEQLSIGGGFVFDARSQGLGGWDLDIHHVYDPIGKFLLLGDGSWRSADSFGSLSIATAAGNGEGGYFSGDDVSATNASFYFPYGVAVGSDGSIYIADSGNNRIRRVRPDGIITTVAGNGNEGFGGDGGPAANASLNMPTGVAVGSDGSIYIADLDNYRIRRVGPDGIITTVAGNGGFDFGSDNGPATSVSIRPSSVAVGSDGSIYIADLGNSNNLIRRVGPDGIIITVAGGNRNWGYLGDGGPATSASLNSPCGVSVGPDGSIYFSEGNRVRRVGPNGIITTVAGNGNQGYGGDGGPAISAPLYSPISTVVGPDSSIYFVTRYDGRIRKVGPDGIITTVAGHGVARYFSGDGGPATSAPLYNPLGIAVGPERSVYIVDQGNNRIRRIMPFLPGVSLSDLYIPSEDGSQLYVFNGSGKHLRTLNALTGAALLSFGYDSGGRLATITDGAGNITTIARDSSGNPTAIVAPFGQRTAFTLDANGYLASVTNPAGESTRMSYGDGGLMTTYIDPKGNIHNFAYDDYGLLVRDDNPAGGYTTLAGTSTPSTKQEVLTTALGRISTYLTEYLSTGDKRQTITTQVGSQRVILTKTDGSEQSTLPDGTTSTVALGIDPRFGIMVSIPASTTIRTPSGLTRSTTLTRTATMDSTNLLSLTSQTDALSINSRVYTTTYDASLKTYTLTTPTGRSSSATIDYLGRPVSLLLAADLTPVRYSFDAQGFLSTISQGSLVTKYGYDILKRLSTVTNANSQTLGFAYDSADRVSKLTLPSGHSYQFTYDANGNRTQITMPNGALHKLGYTTIDLNSDYTPPANLPYAWQYSLDQEWTRTTLPGGRIVDAAYDTGGRPTGIVYPEASLSLLYNDKTDRVSSLTRTPAFGGTAQRIAYTYDGSLVTGQSFSGIANGAFTYTYDNNFFLKQISLVSGSDTVTTAITRDADGLVTAYGPFTFARTGPAGAVSNISDTALNIAVTYDTLGRVATRTHTVNGQNIYYAQFAYDNTGNISQKTENIPNLPSALVYTYDTDGQLVKTQNNGADAETFGYDVNGNRTSYQRPNSTTLSADYDTQDRLQQIGATAYQFNADGQLTQRGQDTFQYSATGELLQDTISGQTITYNYDGTGRRVARTDSAGTCQYLYGNLKQPFQLTAMRDPAGVLSYYYYDDTGKLFAFDKGGTRYYVATDQVDTPKVVSDATGNVVKYLEHDSFGMWTFDSNPDFDMPVGYAGGIVDNQTTLVRFGYRDYEPWTGRWTAKDPIFFEGGQGNLFAYVQNNPVNRRDPSGKDGLPGTSMDFGFLIELPGFRKDVVMTCHIYYDQTGDPYWNTFADHYANDWNSLNVLWDWYHFNQSPFDTINYWTGGHPTYVPGKPRVF